jgi:hypothetical protein
MVKYARSPFGKPAVTLVNALTRVAAGDPSLRSITALTLCPKPSGYRKTIS